MPKRRTKIPQNVIDTLLVLSDHTCNICRESRQVEIHHIDGDPSNNKQSNLIVSCRNCHSEISSRGLAKNYTPGELRKYKAEWEDIVKKRNLLMKSQTVHLFDPESKELIKKLLSNLEKYGTQVVANKRELEEGYVGRILKQAHYIHTLADYLVEKGDYIKSIGVYDFISESDPKNRLYALSNKGRCLFKIGKYEEAVETLKSAIELDPDSVSNLILVSHALFQINRIEDALSYCNKALELDSNNFQALSLKGDLLYAIGDRSEAIILHERLSNIRPRNADLLRHLGVMYCKSGDHNKALATFRNGLDINPTNHDLLYSEALETEHVRGKQSALRLYNKLLSKYPESLKALSAKGKILCDRGEHDNALQLFQKVNILGPDNDDVLYCIGLELDHLRKHKKSIEYYRKSLQINPMNVSALVNLSKQMSTRNPAEALKIVRRALRIDPHHEIGQYNKGVILSKIRNRSRRSIS